MKKLYKFYWDCERMGEVVGIFTAEEDEVNKAIGSEIYFGEILGKHSEIDGELEVADLHIVTEDQAFIKRFDELDCSSGYNPLEYILLD